MISTNRLLKEFYPSPTGMAVTMSSYLLDVMLGQVKNVSLLPYLRLDVVLCSITLRLSSLEFLRSAWISWSLN